MSSFVSSWYRCPGSVAFASLLALSLSIPAPGAGQSGGLGLVSFPNSGAEAAQTPFLHGVLLLHNFEYEDAAEAFREAAAADPGFALAYWGEALTWQRLLWGQDFLDEARAALQKLGPTPEARAKTVHTDRERAYLDAVETLLGPGTEVDRTKRYEAAMARLSETYPDDDEAAVLHALSILWAGDYGEAATAARSAAISEGVARRNPYHPGAVHYLIHAYDSPEMAPLGLHWARVYARLAPAAEHALHMPAHIFLQLGLWEDVVASNEASTAASHAWVERKGLGVRDLDYHSYQWLSYAYLQQGRYREASAIVDSVDTWLGGQRGSDEHWNVANGRMIEHIQWGIETGDWSFFDRSDLPDAKPAGSLSYVLPVYGFGIAAAVRGDSALASRAATGLRAPDSAGEPASKRRQALALQVEALAALHRGEAERAAEIVQESVDLTDDDAPSGPAVFYPAFELQGRILLDAGRAEEAAAAYGKELELRPGRSQALLGRARAYVAMGDSGAASRAYGALLRNWALADQDLPALDEVRREAAR